MGHLLGYARVSTTDQDASLQIDALNAAGCYRVFVDTMSGSLQHRPELDKLLDQLRPGDTLVVWRLDRLGRSIRHLIDQLHALAERGIGFRSLQETIDTTSPGGRLVFHVFAALAEFERDLIKERTNAGLAAARARGRTGGRPSRLSADQVRTARWLYEQQDMTVAQIGDVLGVSRTPSTVHSRSTPSPSAPPNRHRSQRKRRHKAKLLTRFPKTHACRPWLMLPPPPSSHQLAGKVTEPCEPAPFPG